MIVKNIAFRPSVTGFLPSNAPQFNPGPSPILLLPDATFKHDSSDFAGGMMKVGYKGYRGPNDRLSIQNQGTAAGQIGVTGATVTFEGTAIGTRSGGEQNDPEVIVTLNANTTIESIKALLRAVTYHNVNQGTIIPRLREFVVSVRDAAGNTGYGMQLVNNRPILTGSNSQSYHAGDPPLTLFPDATVVDDDSLNFADGGLFVGGADITLAGPFAIDPALNVKMGSTIVGKLGGDHISYFAVALNANATPANVQALLRAVRISTTVDAKTTMTSTAYLSDGDGGVSNMIDCFITLN